MAQFEPDGNASQSITVLALSFQWSISERHVGSATTKEGERQPRSLATHRGCLGNFVGEEAPEARVGPRTPWDNRLTRNKRPCLRGKRLLEIKYKVCDLSHGGGGRSGPKYCTENIGGEGNAKPRRPKEALCRLFCYLKVRVYFFPLILVP